MTAMMMMMMIMMMMMEFKSIVAALAQA